MSPAGVGAPKRLEVRADLVVHSVRHTLGLAQVRHVAGLGDLKDVRVHRNGLAVIQRHQTDTVGHLMCVTLSVSHPHSFSGLAYERPWLVHSIDILFTLAPMPGRVIRAVFASA